MPARRDGTTGRGPAAAKTGIGEADPGDRPAEIGVKSPAEKLWPAPPAYCPVSSPVRPASSLSWKESL
jgi:hypothetical protein